MFEVELAARKGMALCRPKGNLEATTVSAFSGAVSLCLGEPRLIVDLSGVYFIDRAGLTALVGAVRRAREQPDGGPTASVIGGGGRAHPVVRVRIRRRLCIAPSCVPAGRQVEPELV